MTTGIHSHDLQDDGVSWSADTNGGSPPDLSVYAMASSKAVVADPSAANPSTALTQALYLTEPGSAAPVSVSDINQGQLGDCFLLSPLGEEALFHPASITNMIRDNGNGSETVTLFTDQSGACLGLAVPPSGPSR